MTSRRGDVKAPWRSHAVRREHNQPSILPKINQNVIASQGYPGGKRVKVSAITQLLRMLWQISQEFANRGGGKAPFLEKKEKMPFPFALWRGRILNIVVRSEVGPGFF